MNNPHWHVYSLGPNISLHIQLDEDGLFRGDATGTLSIDLGNDRTVKIKSPYLLSENLWSHIRWMVQDLEYMTEDPELHGIDVDVNSSFWVDNKTTKDITFIMHNSVSGVEMSFPVKRNEFDAGLVEIFHDFLVHIPYTHPDDRLNIEWIDGDEPDLDEEPSFDEGPSRKEAVAFAVILEDAGPNRTVVMRILREEVGFNLREVKNLLAEPNPKVIKNVPYYKAALISELLEKAGASTCVIGSTFAVTTPYTRDCPVIEYIDGCKES